MATFSAPNADFANAVRSAVMSFPVARLIGFDFGRIVPGEVDLLLPYREELSQGSGTVQAGIVGLLADVAAVSAAGTLLPPGYLIVTCDYTIKLVAPARGERLVARGVVVKPGQSLTVSRADVFAVSGDRERLCATTLTTAMSVKVTP